MEIDTSERLFARLAELRRQLDAVATDIHRAIVAPSAGGESAPSDVTLVATARRLIASRSIIGEIFDAALFADPATKIVLQLYIDHHDGDVTTSGACCAVAGIPRTTGLRLITLLCGRGLMETNELPGDRRLTRVELTPSGLEKARQMLERLHALFYANEDVPS